ncbi:MAG TPA: hypothetical protein VL147_01685, partial [Devosia sp.]|nr:hypothetical protein [Devosia sp.]
MARTFRNMPFHWRSKCKPGSIVEARAVLNHPDGNVIAPFAEKLAVNGAGTWDGWHGQAAIIGDQHRHFLSPSIAVPQVDDPTVWPDETVDKMAMQTVDATFPTVQDTCSGLVLKAEFGFVLPQPHTDDLGRIVSRGRIDVDMENRTIRLPPRRACNKLTKLSMEGFGSKKPRAEHLNMLAALRRREVARQRCAAFAPNLTAEHSTARPPPPLCQPADAGRPARPQHRYGGDGPLPGVATLTIGLQNRWCVPARKPAQK